MKNWREVLKMERKTAQERDPFAPPPRYNWCIYFEGMYLLTHENDPETPMAVRHAEAFRHALNSLPLTFPEEQIFWGGAETFRSDKLLPGVTDEAYEKACQVFYKEGGVRFFSIGFDHTIPDYRRLMSQGLGDFIARAQCAAAKNDSPAARGMLIALEAIRDFARRAAQSLRIEQPAASARLERISEKSPRNFGEALQLMWLIFVVLEAEGRRHNALGRMDQYLYPAFLSGGADRKEALDLLCHIFTKIEGFHEVTNICIGGVTPKGDDAANELSELILQAVDLVHSASTNLSARLHRNSTDRFLLQCIELIQTGIGFPAVFNDEINVNMLHRLGIPLEAARDYALVGCVECIVPGRQVAWSDGRFNMPQIFTRTMAELAECSSYEELWAKFRDNMRSGLTQYENDYNQLLTRFAPEQYPDPVLSAFTANCIAKGLDVNDGGAEFMRLHGIGMMGLATLTDSLATVHKLVFDEKKISAEELVKALQNDFQEQEELRQTLLHCAPKYGNDEELTNRIAADIVRLCSELCAELHSCDGGFLQSCMASNISNIPAGAETSATPDGRHAGEPLSDASSPVGGRDRKGPTAFLNSVLAPDYSMQNCTVVNMRFLPEMFQTQGGRERMMVLLRKFIECGGHELQFNVTDNQLLEKAMEKPEEYGDLIVRVSGFSAFFTGLSHEVQKDIARRHAHGGR